jgi:hypothetical protein
MVAPTLSLGAEVRLITASVEAAEHFRTSVVGEVAW